jgi:pyocin large subunit-like protein
MMIKLEHVHEDVSSPLRQTPVQNPTEEVDVNGTPNHSKSRQTISAPNNSAVSTHAQRPPDTHTSRLKADEEHFTDGDDAFSTQAILSAYTKKTEKLFNNLNEVVTTHSRTSVKERVELIKRYYSRMKEQDQK